MSWKFKKFIPLAERERKRLLALEKERRKGKENMEKKEPEEKKEKDSRFYTIGTVQEKNDKKYIVFDAVVLRGILVHPQLSLNPTFFGNVFEADSGNTLISVPIKYVPREESNSSKKKL